MQGTTPYRPNWLMTPQEPIASNQRKINIAVTFKFDMWFLQFAIACYVCKTCLQYRQIDARSQNTCTAMKYVEYTLHPS